MTLCAGKVINTLKKTDLFDYDKYLSSKPSKVPPTEGPDVDAQPDEAASSEQSEKTVRSSPKKNRTPKSPKKKSEKPDAVDSFKNALDEALDEDVAEIAEFSVTRSLEEIPVPKKRSFKRSLYFVIGVAVSFMSLIGFISTIFFCTDVIAGIADNTKQKEEFSNYIYPVVIVDPAPFEQTSQLTSDMVISAAIWDIILHQDVSKYPEEFGTMTIPQLDVEQHATSLFGVGLTFEHKTLGDAVLGFYYTEETKSYNVPISPKYFPYSPMIENVKRDGNNYILRVGYVSPSPAWLIKNKNTDVKPDKYMEYILTKNANGNNYIITGIKDLYDNNHIPSDT